MRKEGCGVVRPPVVSILVPDCWASHIDKEARRRTVRDRTSSDKWIRGISPSAYATGMRMEYAVSTFTGWPMDWRHQRDGGRDFTFNGMRFDAKSTSKMEIPAIREKELAKHKADAYIFGKVVGNEVFLYGWMTAQEMKKRSNPVELPSGNNRQPKSPEFRPMNDLIRHQCPRNVLRYPGGKSTIFRHVEERMHFYGDLFSPHLYVEPFVGGGGMMCRLLKKNKIRKMWINDIDRSLMQLYESIRDFPGELKSMLCSFVPSVDAWRRAKEVDGKCDNPVKGGFAKLVLHVCSHAGLGYMAGGPQGGVKQQSKYPIGCRWNPFRISNMVTWLSPRLQEATITNQSVFEMDIPDDAFVFADPPYVSAGTQLYRHSFSGDDHVRLRNRLIGRKSWAATYDDCDLVRSLYNGCSISAFDMTTGNNHARKYREVVITP